MPAPTVSREFMQAVFDYLAQQEVQEHQVLEQMGLSDKSQMLINGRVPLHLYEQLYEVAEQITGDVYIGLHVGTTPLPQSWGLVSYLAMTAPNVLTALQALMQYSMLQLDFGHFKMHESSRGNITVTWQSDLPKHPNRHILEHLHANVTVLAKSQIGLSLMPQHTIYFKHAAAGDPAYVGQLLATTVLYDQDEYKTEFPKEFLEQASGQPQEELFVIAGNLAKEQLKALRNDDRLVNEVHQHIVERLPYGLPKLEDIAAMMDLAPRTLQRRLQERNLKYQHLLDDVRHELALDIITKAHYSLNEIAEYLGFNDQSAFQRAFKRWEGITPGKYRNNAGLG